MPTEPRHETTARDRVATRDELHRFYRAIGISAVASASQAAKMARTASTGERHVPSFLRKNEI